MWMPTRPGSQDRVEVMPELYRAQRGFSRLASFVALGCVLSFDPPAAQADCALIPAAVRTLPSNDGMVDRPYAAPGDTLMLFSDGACKPSASEPHFDLVAANNEITITFTPPTGATPPVVAPFPASAVLDCGSDRCFAVEFQMPDTTGLAGAFPLTGPATIEVRNTAVVGNPVVATINELFEPAQGCNNQNRTRSLFRNFSVLPPRNVYDPTGVNTLLAAVDGTGSLLIPLDYSMVLASPVGGGSGTVRLLSITADLPNGLAAGNGLPAPDDALLRVPRFGRFVRAFSLNGRPIPPLLKIASSEPLNVGGVEYGDTIVGSVDFVDSVLRIAQVADDPSAPGTPLKVFALDGEEPGAPPGLAMQNGLGPVDLTGVTLSAGAAAPLNSVLGSSDLAVVARDEALEAAFGIAELNGDGDSDDRVPHFIDLKTNNEFTTGMAVVETARSPRKAVIAAAGSYVAFLESESFQGRTDFNDDNDALDGLLRVYNADGTHPLCAGAPCELTAGLAVTGNPATLIREPGGQSPVVISGGADPERYTFFGRAEFEEATLANQRLSLSDIGGETDGPSTNPNVSANGQFVAYTSTANNIVSGSPGGPQIYRADLLGGSNELISTPFRGSLVGGNGPSDNASISLDGKSVTFDSFADNIGENDAQGHQDVFLWEQGSINVRRLSLNPLTGLGGDGPSKHPDLSNDATAVAFETLAANIVPGDSNGESDIIRVSGPSYDLVSVTNSGAESNGASTHAAISGDGNAIAFETTATNMLGGVDANGAVSDIYLRDFANSTTERISVGYAGAEPNGASYSPQVSHDGRYVVYASDATNLIAPGTNLNGARQCYLYDRVKKTTELVSANLAGQGGDGDCLSPNLDISARYITYASDSTNLDPSQTTAVQQIYFLDRLTGNSVIASTNVISGAPTAGPTGTRSSIGSIVLGILVFESAAGDFGIPDSNMASDVYGDVLLAGPSFNSTGTYADLDSSDTVLFVYDNFGATLHNTGIPMSSTDGLGRVAVAGGRAAVATSNGTGIPGAGAIWDQEAGGVLRLMGGGSVFPIDVALSDTVYCALDAPTSTLFVGDPKTGAAFPTSIGIPLSATAQVGAVGDRCVVIDQLGVLQIAERVGGVVMETSIGPAADFQVADAGVAFRTCESAVAMDLNGDTDLSDCNMRFWDFATFAMVDTGHVAVPCTFPGCDPFFEPYRAGPGIISFVTSEIAESDSGGSGAVGMTCLPTSPAGICDKTGDEDGDDVAVEIFSLASGRAQVFPVKADNPPLVAPFPKVVPGSSDNVMVVQLPADLLGADFQNLPAEQLVTVIVGDPEGDGVFEADGNTDPQTNVVDKCQEVADPDQADVDGDGMGEDCDFVIDTTIPNDVPGAPGGAPALLPGGNLCDLNKSMMITRAEVDQVWFDRGTQITPPVDLVAPFGVFEPSDDRDRDVDGEITSVDFRLCLADCEAQAGGCPAVEGGPPGFGFGTGGFGCGLIGIESLLVLLPWAWRKRKLRKARA